MPGAMATGFGSRRLPAPTTAPNASTDGRTIVGRPSSDSSPISVTAASSRSSPPETTPATCSIRDCAWTRSPTVPGEPADACPDASAAIFGLAVFIAPSAVTSFSRQNLPQSDWGAAVSLFTLVFAVGQTIGPVAAGALGDRFGEIGPALLAAALLLLVAAAVAAFQKPLRPAA